MDGPWDLHLHLHLNLGRTWGPCDLLSAVVTLASRYSGWIPVSSWELLRWKDPPRRGRGLSSVLPCPGLVGTEATV